MELKVINPKSVSSAEIVIGIPSFNEAENISYPTDVASRGLCEFFPGKSAVLINADNNSPDGTAEVFLHTPTKIPQISISTPGKVRGKGTNIRNILKASVELNAKIIILLDADLISIAPNWIRHLAEPLLGRFDFVTPIYVRDKNDGAITNHIAYPLLRTLFGMRVRQPNGGEFGISGKLARAFLSEKMWTENIARYGIDIWMSTVAIARHFNVCQAFLATPKVHSPEHPDDLAKVMKQVAATFFDLMIEFEYIWKDTFYSRPGSIFGFGLGVVEKPPEIKIDGERLQQNFLQDFKKYEEIWKKIIPMPEFRQLIKLKETKTPDKFYFASNLWARILFGFAVAFRNFEDERELLLDSLVPIFFSRILSYYNRTRKLDTKDAEEYLENISRIFEKEKYYLIQLWNDKDSSSKMFS